MAEHMTVCGGHLEADDTPNQIYRYAHGHGRLKNADMF